MSSGHRQVAVVATATLLLAGALQGSREAPLPRAESPVLPARLADTGLYLDGGTATVDPKNRPFAPQYPLWSDGLTKRRWIYLPPDALIDASDDAEWRLPVGTRFWKEFSHGARRIETRFLWKVSESRWAFASYAWNDEGTDARLAPDDGQLTDAEVAPGRRHVIPSRSDCAACHGTPAEGRALGFNALQLSPDRDPNAIHGEPLQPGMLSLVDLVGDRRLSGSRPDLLARPPRIRTGDPGSRAVLGYLAANCSMCHNGRGEIAALGPTIRYRELLEDGDAVARGLVGQATKWQVPGAPEGRSVLVHPGVPESSAIFVRMRSRSPSSQMPPLGTVVRDALAVDAIGRWISVEMMRSH